MKQSGTGGSVTRLGGPLNKLDKTKRRCILQTALGRESESCQPMRHFPHQTWLVAFVRRYWVVPRWQINWKPQGLSWHSEGIALVGVTLQGFLASGDPNGNAAQDVSEKTQGLGEGRWGASVQWGRSNGVVDPQPCLISASESNRGRYILERTGKDFAVDILGHEKNKLQKIF